MRQFFGMSKNGDLAEAVKGLDNPQFIMLMSNNAQFETHVKTLEKYYPGVPSIGCIGMSYDIRVVEEGVGVVAFYDGVSAAANVLEQVSVMPAKYIKRLEEDVQIVNGTSADTVCIDFCSGNDACVLTTINTVLNRRGISLVGGTGDAGKVAVNGRIYEDAVAYAIVRNLNGKVKTYKENIYRKHGNIGHGQRKLCNRNAERQVCQAGLQKHSARNGRTDSDTDIPESFWKNQR